MSQLTPFVLTWSALLACQAVTHPAPDPDAVADEHLLRQAAIPTDDHSLLQFFRSRTLTRAQQAHFQALIAQLGDRAYNQRQKATATLLRTGAPARALLLAATRLPECEAARRAELCLRQLPPDPDPQHGAAVARVLARRQPAGAAEVLLGYLPFAADVPVSEAVRSALGALALRDPQPPPALVEALGDTLPLKRAAAAEALARVKAPGLDAGILRALKEPDPQLRLQVALALLDARRPESVPALIDLVRDLPGRDAWRAEEALRLVAGARAPDLFVGGNTPGAKVREAWARWWREHGPSLDLARIDLKPALLGHTLLTLMDPVGSTGRVLELGPGRQVKWEIAGLRYPVDAEVVGPDRVLVAEFFGRKVSERDFSARVIWEIDVPDLPVACQRLPGGQTFIATRRRLFVVDRSGKEVFTYHHEATSIAAARKLPDGHMVLVSGGLCSWLDSSGKQVKSFPVGLVYTLGGNIDVLPSGRVLVPEYNENRVIEYDREGKPGWSVRVNSPTSAVRLPNGHTLVVSMPEQRVIEFNRAGQEIWSHATPGRLWRARRR
ncbi:MAG: HEAT repeat domain-containing protein [Gemmataceae bacterium]|nr:HEAT repeat domain-containing protein [Gemmataceae bacterium]